MSFNLQLSKSENIKAMFSAPNYLYTHEKKNISTAFSTCPCFKAYIFRSTIRMQWGCHHLFRSYERNLSNIANIRLHSVSGHTITVQRYETLSRHTIRLSPNSYHLPIIPIRVILLPVPAISAHFPDAILRFPTQFGLCLGRITINSSRT